jgi:Tfp pilus assembly ATPase PilU
MQTMDQALADLVQKGVITRTEARTKALSKDQF